MRSKRGEHTGTSATVTPSLPADHSILNTSSTKGKLGAPARRHDQHPSFSLEQLKKKSQRDTAPGDLAPEESADSGELTYELIPAKPLATLDLSVSIVSALFGPTAEAQQLALMRRHMTIMLIAYNIGAIAACAGMFLPVRLGEAMAWTGLILLLPWMIGNLLLTRWQVWLLLFKTFDFWFLNVLNVLRAAFAIGISRNDLRGPPTALVVLLCAVAPVAFDAHTFNRETLSQGMAGGAVGALLAGVAVQLGWCPGLLDYTWMIYGEHSVTLFSLYLNVNLTFTVAFAKVMIFAEQTRRQKRRQMSQAVNTISCLLYSCNLKIRAAGANTSLVNDKHKHHSTGPVIKPPQDQEKQPKDRYIVQLQLLPPSFKGLSTRPSSDAVYLQVPRGRRFTYWGNGGQMQQRRKKVLQILFNLAMVLGNGCSYLVIVSKGYVVLSLSPTALTAIAIVGLLCTLLVVVVTVCLSARPIVILLYRNPDVQYTAFLAITLCLGLSEVMAWDVRCIALGTLCLWVQWTNVFDSLLPPSKTLLGVSKKSHLVPVLFSQTLWLVWMTFQLYFGPRESYQNRILWEGLVIGQPVVLQIYSYVTNGLLGLFVWILRLLWRAAATSEDTLVIQQGTVEYHSPFVDLSSSAAGNSDGGATTTVAVRSIYVRNPLAKEGHGSSS